jgi:hypothetical protein
MVGFPASLESSPSPEQMECRGNFLSKWNFSGILFGRLLARIAEYLLNGSLREVNFHMDIQEARGFMDSYDKDTIIEIYAEWLTTSTVTFAKELN